MPPPILTAEIIAIGSELTAGDTRDTNGGDLARDLTARGVEVRRMTCLPDDLGIVTNAFVRALRAVDLVVSSGGLGPTPDDLTREAIAAACGETPAVDPALEAWLKGLFERRGQRMGESNRKQAWLIPSATPLANRHGTAPGWWVRAAGGGIIVALPGPPRELWPMWRDEALTRLEQQGLGTDHAEETLHLTAIGESALAELIGPDRLGTRNPVVATYARTDSVDVRISARAADGHSAREIATAAVAELEPLLAPYLFARGDETWTTAIERELAGRTLAFVEIGVGGQLGALIGAAPWVTYGEFMAAPSAARPDDVALGMHARRVRDRAGSDIGLAVLAGERGDDTDVRIAIAAGSDVHETQRTAFLTGDQGRRRAALAACAVLWQQLAVLAARKS